MTLTFEPDLDSVKKKRRTKYRGQTSFSSTVIIGDTYTPDRLLYLDH